MQFIHSIKGEKTHEIKKTGMQWTSNGALKWTVVCNTMCICFIQSGGVA